MPDTPRSLAAILSLFADNTTQEISPQDLRDFVVSVATPISSFYTDVLVLDDSGLTIGGDTNLYRVGANVLKTDDIFQADQLYLNPGAFGQMRLASTVDNKPIITFGPSEDTNLYRYGANVLATDDQLLLPAATSTDETKLYVRSGFLKADGSFDQSYLVKFGWRDDEIAGYMGVPGAGFGSNAGIVFSDDQGATVAAFGRFGLGLRGKPIYELAGPITFSPRNDVARGIYMLSNGNIPTLDIRRHADQTTAELQRWITEGEAELAAVTHDGGFRGVGHSALGPDASIDQEILIGYTPSSQSVTIAEDFADTSATSFLDSPLGLKVRYNRSTAFPGGEYAPSIYGLTVEAEYLPTTGTDPTNSNDLVGVLSIARLRPTATMPPNSMYGTEVAAFIDSGAPAMASKASGVQSNLTILGSSPSAPFTGAGYGAAGTFAVLTQRTGTYEVRTLDVRSPIGGGNPSHLTGLYIEPHTNGTTESWNLYSEGTSSRMKHEGHVAFGNDADVDPGPIDGLLSYASTSTVLTIADEWTSADPGDGLLLSGMYAYAEFTRDTAYGTGEGEPSMAAVVGKTTWNPGSGATGSDFGPGVLSGGYFGVDVRGATNASFATGVTGEVVVQAGKATDFGSTAVAASGAFIGVSSLDPGDYVGLSSYLYTQRTGGNYDATMAHLFMHVSSTGTPANLYGLRIGAMTAASGANYNILSEGTTTKNKFQGRVFEGTPNSAPTDGDIDNGQITAYLDQTNNKLKWRTKYSDGTLKTASVDLESTALKNQVVLRRFKNGGVANAMYRLSDMTVINAIPAGQTQYYAFPILQPDSGDTDFGTAGQLYDPNSWIVATTVVEAFWWNKTFPAYTVLSLPAGYYQWTMRVELQGSTGSDSWDVFFDQIGDYSSIFTTHIKEDYPFTRTDSGPSRDDQRLAPEESLTSGTFYLPNAAMCVPVIQIFSNTNARQLRTFELTVTRVTT